MSERVLLIQTRQLGDILLTTPCIAALRQAWPQAHIAFLAHAMGRPILEGQPGLDECFFYDPAEGLRGELRVAAALRTRRFDLVLDFMNNNRTALYALATGATDRISYRSTRRIAYSRLIPKLPRTDYIVREKLRFLQALGLEPAEAPPLIPWEAPDARVAGAFFAEQVEPQGLHLRVALSPTHRRAPRRWPLPSYAALADHLREAWGASIIWLWGPGEEAVIAEVQSLCREPGLVAPRTTLREAAALLASCDLFIGNSNGPSHVAVAAGTPSFQIHGPTHARSWSPLTPEHQAIEAADLPDGARAAIRTIGVSEVLNALGKLRPIVEAAAGRRLRRGPRASWRD